MASRPLATSERTSQQQASLQQRSVLVMGNPGSQGERGKHDLKARMGEDGDVHSMSQASRIGGLLDELKCSSRVVPEGEWRAADQFEEIVASLRAAVRGQSAQLAEHELVMEKQRAACEEQERMMEGVRAGLKAGKLLLEKREQSLETAKLLLEKGKRSLEKAKLSLEKGELSLETARAELDEVHVLVEQQRIEAVRRRAVFESAVNAFKEELNDTSWH